MQDTASTEELWGDSVNCTNTTGASGRTSGREATRPGDKKNKAC